MLVLGLIFVAHARTRRFVSIWTKIPDTCPLPTYRILMHLIQIPGKIGVCWILRIAVANAKARGMQSNIFLMNNFAKFCQLCKNRVRFFLLFTKALDFEKRIKSLYPRVIESHVWRHRVFSISQPIQFTLCWSTRCTRAIKHAW